MKFIVISIYLWFALSNSNAQSKVDSLKEVLSELEHRKAIVEAKISEVRANLEKLEPPAPVMASIKTKPKYNCPALVSDVTDKMTGKRLISAPKKDILLANKLSEQIAFSWTLSPENDVLFMSLLLNRTSQCVEKEAEVYFLFTDGTRKVFMQDAAFNCDGIVLIDLSGQYYKKYLDAFEENTLSAIRVYTSKSYVEVNVSAQSAMQIRQSLACIRENIID